MNCDLLLEWMTHLGSGAWASFREAVAELADDQSDPGEEGLYRALRIALSDLGHVDFFIGGSSRWQVMKPALLCLAGSSEHLLVGGRTRSLVDRLRAAANGLPAGIAFAESIPGLSRIQVVGGPDSIRSAADDLGIEYIADAAGVLCSQLPSIRDTMARAEASQAPINWSVRSWSFQDEQWIPDQLERTVREYSNRHGVRRYLVHLGRAGLHEIEKRASFYCAALVRGFRIGRYSHQDWSLRVPRWAPLPAAYARAACLASGKLATIRDGDIVFENVDPRIASTLLVGLGQGFPMPEALR